MASTMDLSGTNVMANISGTATETQDIGVTATAVFALKESQALADGTGADSADVVIFKSGTLAFGVAVDTDLSGAESDVFGDTVTMDKVKAFMVKNTSDELGVPTIAELRVGGGDNDAGNAAFDTWTRSAAVGGAGDGSEAIRLFAGGACIVARFDATGYVVAGGADEFRIKNVDGALDAGYEMLVIGEST